MHRSNDFKKKKRQRERNSRSPIDASVECFFLKEESERERGGRQSMRRSKAFLKRKDRERETIGRRSMCQSNAFF